MVQALDAGIDGLGHQPGEAFIDTSISLNVLESKLAPSSDGEEQPLPARGYQKEMLEASLKVCRNCPNPTFCTQTPNKYSREISLSLYGRSKNEHGLQTLT